MTDLDELELRSTFERREGVIRILERDLRESERKRRKLHEALTRLCQEEHCFRCGIQPKCHLCTIKKTLEECK